MALTDIGSLIAQLERAVDRCCPAHLRSSRDDIVQAAALKATEALESGREVNRAWLKRVAYTTMIDEIRQRGVVYEPMPVESKEPDPEVKTRLARVRDALDRCMAHLRDARRRAVLLFLQGHSAREISVLLDVKPRAAENLVFRGRAELRTCLVKHGATLESV